MIFILSGVGDLGGKKTTHKHPVAVRPPARSKKVLATAWRHIYIGFLLCQTSDLNIIITIIILSGEKVKVGWLGGGEAGGWKSWDVNAMQPVINFPTPEIWHAGPGWWNIGDPQALSLMLRPVTANVSPVNKDNGQRKMAKKREKLCKKYASGIVINPMITLGTLRCPFLYHKMWDLLRYKSRRIPMHPFFFLRIVQFKFKTK